MENTLQTNETEIKFLNILFSNPLKFHDLKNIKPWVFGASQHQVLFETISELTSKGLVADRALVESTLASSGRMDLVGGPEYINYIVKQVVSEENINEFEKIILEAYRLRSLGGISTELIKGIKNQSSSDLIEDTKRKLDSLELVVGGDRTISLNTAIVKAVTNLNDKLEHPGIGGTKTGIPDIDFITGGIFGGEVWYIGARPSMGKTALACNMSLSMGIEGIPNLVIEREMRDTSLVERFWSIDSGVGIADIKNGRLDKKQTDKITVSTEKIKNYPIYIDTFFGSDFDYIISTIKKFKNNFGIKVAFIDYIQLAAERNENQTQELGDISRKLKLLANEYDIGIVVLSQLNRAVELRDDKRPVMSDLRQCGNLEEDGDIVACLYRPCIYEKDMKNSNILEFIIRKQREGPIGTLNLEFLADVSRITNKPKRG